MELTQETLIQILDERLDAKFKDFATNELDAKFKDFANNELDAKFKDFAANELDAKFKDFAANELEERLKELPTRQDYNAIMSKLDDIQETVRRIDKRADEDVRAAYKDIEKHEKRITVLENTVGIHA